MLTPAPSRQALIGVGSNLGDRQAMIGGALERLRGSPGVAWVEASPVFETEPVGVADQPKFLNAVFGLATTLSPEELLETLLTTEREFGRVRRERWGPRTLDLDLLTFEGESRTTPQLTLPHPRMWERAFVMEPLREVLEHPRFPPETWRDLRTRLAAAPRPANGVRKIEWTTE